MKRDPELATIRKIMQALHDLPSDEARQRVIKYIGERANEMLKLQLEAERNVGEK